MPDGRLNFTLIYLIKPCGSLLTNTRIGLLSECIRNPLPLCFFLLRHFDNQLHGLGYGISCPAVRFKTMQLYLIKLYRTRLVIRQLIVITFYLHIRVHLSSWRRLLCLYGYIICLFTDLYLAHSHNVAIALRSSAIVMSCCLSVICRM